MMIDYLVVHPLERQEQVADVLWWVLSPSLENTVDDFKRVPWSQPFIPRLDRVEESKVTHVCIWRVGWLLVQDDLVHGKKDPFNVQLS